MFLLCSRNGCTLAFSKFSIFDGRSRLLAPFRLPRDPSPLQGSGHGYDPSQPRVPRGNPDGGQWTRDTFGSSGSVDEERPPDTRERLDRSWIRLAANERRPGSLVSLLVRTLLHQGLKSIKEYLEKNRLPDLFGDKDKKDDWVVAVTSVNGQVVFGTNSDVWNYPDSDDATAKRLRGILIEKVPDMNRRHLGRKPNDVVFHAETTVLLRAAKVNGGTLAGQTLEVVVNQPMCNVCKMILPHIGMELGNPVAFFTDVTGARRKMHNGAWQNLE